MYSDEEDCLSLTTRFPKKLWHLVNDCTNGAIHWNASGTSILLDYKKFHDEYLNSQKTRIFKTSNLTSFIRQLNLYGFRKVTSHNRDTQCNSRNPDIHEFLHEYFQRHREDLLMYVCRKTSRKSKRLLDHGKAMKHHHNREVSRLKMCQFALTKALEQAVEDYRRRKLREQVISLVNPGPSTSYDFH